MQGLPLEQGAGGKAEPVPPLVPGPRAEEGRDHVADRGLVLEPLVDPALRRRLAGMEAGDVGGGGGREDGGELGDRAVAKEAGEGRDALREPLEEAPAEGVDEEEDDGVRRGAGERAERVGRQGARVRLAGERGFDGPGDAREAVRLVERPDLVRPRGAGRRDRLDRTPVQHTARPRDIRWPRSSGFDRRAAAFLGRSHQPRVQTGLDRTRLRVMKARFPARGRGRKGTGRPGRSTTARNGPGSWRRSGPTRSRPPVSGEGGPRPPPPRSPSP